MPGTFDPINIKGSSLVAESQVEQPNNNAAALAQGALTIFEGAATQVGLNKISSVQDEFVADATANRTDQASIDTLKEVGPGEESAFAQAQNQIKTLQGAIDGRAISPSEALTRIESIKRKTKALAPSFASNIDALTGTRGGSSFDTEAKRIIDSEKTVTDGVAASGGNINSPNDRRLWQAAQQSELLSKKLTADKNISSAEKSRGLSLAVNDRINYFKQKIVTIAGGAGNLSNLSAQDISSFITELTPLTGTGAEAEYTNMLLELNVDPATIDKETYDRGVAQLRGSAEMLIKQFDGSIPKNVTENSIAIADNNIMLKMLKDAEALYAATKTLQMMPAGSGAEKAVSSVVATGLAQYIESVGAGDLSKLTRSGIISAGTPDAISVQRAAAFNFEGSRTFLATTPSTFMLQGHFTLADNVVEAIIRDPGEFAPEMFSSMLNHANSTEVMNNLKKIDPALEKSFSDGVRDMVKQYTQGSMNIAINDQLGASMSIQGVSGDKVSDFVTPRITETGRLVFQANTGDLTGKQRGRIVAVAEKMNRQYGRISSNIALTIQNQAIGGSEETVQDVMIRMMQPIFKTTGTALAEKPTEIGTEKSGRQFLRDIQKQVSDTDLASSIQAFLDNGGQ